VLSYLTPSPLFDVYRKKSEEDEHKGNVELSLQEEIQRVTNIRASAKIK